MARPSMFGELSGGRRLQGVISKAAAKRFDVHRKDLAVMAREVVGWRGAISDGAVIEYLARGRSAAMEFFVKAAKKAGTFGK